MYFLNIFDLKIAYMQKLNFNIYGMSTAPPLSGGFSFPKSQVALPGS